MKRDFDLIRLLLIEQEGEEVDLAEYSEDQINYHKALLIEAGFADGEVHYSGRGGRDSNKIPYFVYIKKLTWDGHEFLNKVRSNSVWKKNENHNSTTRVIFVDRDSRKTEGGQIFILDNSECTQPHQPSRRMW